MFQEIKKYKKWKVLYNLKEPEVKISIIITLIFCAGLYLCDFEKNFSVFAQTVCDILGIVCGGILGLIGFSVAGIAFITSLFDNKQMKIIEATGQEEKIENIMMSYVFSAFISGIVFIFLVFQIIFIKGPTQQIESVLFWVVSVADVYSILFCVFYIISLSYNTIELYKLKNTYQKVTELEKSLYESVNEVRIDFIIKALMELCDESLESIHSKMQMFIENSEIKDKNEILQYLNSHYNK